jgi:PIN domain nuclease of toxin-antitoxin system
MVFVSAASHWEIAVKMSIGKLKLAESFPDFVQHAIFDNGFAIVPIDTRHTAELITLPYHHRDPFDRMIVAQAIVEAMPIVSVDPILDAYPIRRIW